MARSITTPSREEREETREGEMEGREEMESTPTSPRGRKPPKGAKGRKAGKKGCTDCEGCGGTCGGAMKKRRDSIYAAGFQMDAAELGAILTPSAIRSDLKCGKGAISQGEKCRKGAATKAQGPNALVQAGQTAKLVGRGALETVKWTSGYNIGKHIATGMTSGKNEKGTAAQKISSVALSTFAFGPQAGIGAARRVGAFGNTDLQQHAINEKKEKKWRRSVGYRDSSIRTAGK